MKIYKFNADDVKKELNNMKKTYYGKIVFILCYSLPLLSLITSILLYVLSLNEPLFIVPYILLIVFTLISFVIGTLIFYNNFKEYVENK